MPELVTNGPDIPVSLMNELDNGRVVFFCGAGISSCPGSELPSYAGLVKQVYEVNRITPDSVECEALDIENVNFDNLERGRPNFDRAFGLLERPERLGSQRLRRTIIDCLSVVPIGPLRTHEALIKLSRTEQGVRLITTNFDDRFVEAGIEKDLVDASPKLPIPKPHSWSSLVHLHGRIQPQNDGLDLVITAADFGRAYLTEAWAARFITELFREFTVVFVGYSVSDPVMGYMVDALAAERDKGARFMTAYAFADYERTDTLNRQKVHDGWLAKNIEPVLYNKQDRHRFLEKTLSKWAEIRDDPFQARSEIALNEMSKLPAGPDDPVVERVTWALQDPVATRSLAETHRYTDETDFPKLEIWLDMFDQKGLLCCVAIDSTSSSSDQHSAIVHLVNNGFSSSNPNNLDNVRYSLVRWIAGHLHVPQLLAWVLRKGGQMHPDLSRQVEIILAAKAHEIPAKLRYFWTIMLDSKPTDIWENNWTYDRYKAATSESECRYIEEQVVASIVPHLEVQPGPSSRLAFRQYIHEEVEPISPIDACAHITLTTGDKDARDQIRDILEDTEVLSRHAETLTCYLEQALTLGMDDDEVYKDSTLYRPSIEQHDQNQENDEWTHLIDLARNSYFALVATDRGRSDNLLRRWVLSKQPLFRRLAIHVITNDPKSDIRLAQKLLVSGRWPGIWYMELRREVLRFLRLAGSRLPRWLRVSVVESIHAGPKSNENPEFIHREKALRLYKLAASGAKIDKRSMALASECQPATEETHDDNDEFRNWHSEATWIAQEDFASNKFLHGSIADLSISLQDTNISPAGFHELALQQPIKAASALKHLAEQRKWPTKYWKRYLWSIYELKVKQTLNNELLEDVALILVSATDDFFAHAGSSVAGFVKLLAEEWDIDREDDIRPLWVKSWNGIGSISINKIDVDNVLNDALNHAAGKLAEAALTRLWKYKPKTNEGFPEPVRPYFDTIIVDPNGHLGRVMLAMRLYSLFAIDRHWVKERMLPLLNPESSEEASNLWSGYAYSPTVSPDLLHAFKEQLLQVLKNSKRIGRRKRNLIGLFLTICLEASNELTNEEIHGVIDSMAEEDLKNVLDSVKNRFKGSTIERAQIWSDKVQPWLDRYWPNTGTYNTAGISNSLLGMLIECGDAFPRAVEWSLSYLRPIDGSGLYLLKKNGYIEQNPYAIFEILNKVIDGNTIQAHFKETLKSILDELKQVKPELVADPRFQRLYQIATQ